MAEHTSEPIRRDRAAFSQSLSSPPGNINPILFSPTTPTQHILRQKYLSLHSEKRRGSFIYRDSLATSPFRFTSRSPSLIPPTPDGSTRSDAEGLVTPFAQVLRGLQDLHTQNLAMVSAMKEKEDSENSAAGNQHEGYSERITKMEDMCSGLRWCMEELDKMSSDGTAIGKFATSKFKRLLTSELSSLSDGNPQMEAVANWISSTFVEPDRDAEFARLPRGQRPRSGSVALAVQQYRRHVAQTSSLRNVAESPAGSAPKRRSLRISSTDQEQLDEVLGKLDNWEFDVFTVSRLTDKRPLAAVMFTIFQERDLLVKFQIPESTLLNYATVLEAAYLDNPYHNSIHAADVAQTAHSLLLSKVFDGQLSDLEILATIFAAAIHDVAHPGVNNDFMIDSGHELAMLYNDRSVLENHHIATGFKLLQRGPNCNIFEKLDRKCHFRPLRKLVVELVLSTDPHQHLNNLGAFKSWVEHKQVHRMPDKEIQLDEEKDAVMVLQALLHSADISNPCKQGKLSWEWSERITTELFAQGDKCRELGMDVPPHMDRLVMTISSLQIGFIKNIAMPQWEAWSEFVTDCETPLSHMDANLKHWTEISDKEKQQKSAEADAPVDDNDDTEKPAELTGKDAEFLEEALTPLRNSQKFFSDDKP